MHACYLLCVNYQNTLNYSRKKNISTQNSSLSTPIFLEGGRGLMNIDKFFSIPHCGRSHLILNYIEQIKQILLIKNLD